MAVWRTPLALVVLLALGAILTACGEDDVGETALIISQTSQPDHLDPALSSELSGWEPMWLVYTPLLTYRRAAGEEGTELIPALAVDLPEVSADGTVYRLTLREGLAYADDTPVVAGDFEHTIKRVLALGSPGSTFYSGIVGAREYADGNDPRADIEGIETDDETGEITIRLRTPDATFANVLAMNYAGLVPSKTPFHDLSADPPPGVGPYEIAASEPGRRFVLERNESFTELDLPEIPTGSIDRITTKIIASERRQAQDVIDNKLDYMHDTPPAEVKPAILEQAIDRYAEHPTASTYYFFLNTRIAPFDDPLVREAVNRGIDRAELARFYAGSLAPGCAFLPPGMPGYDKSLDTAACPYGDPTRAPKLDAARALIRQAGARDTKVSVWGSTNRETKQVTRAYVRMLDRIGLDAEPRLIGSSEYYEAIGDRSSQAQTGFTTWFEDFPHPLNFFALVDGDSIQASSNPNPGNIDDPLLNREIDRLRAEQNLRRVTGEWSELDRYLVSPPQSYIAPFGHKKIATFFSERIDFEAAIFHPLYHNDYSSWMLKEGE